MNLRKDRVHQTGTSNLTNSAAKSKLSSPFPNSLNTSPLASPGRSLAMSPTRLSMASSTRNNADDIIKKKAARAAISPQEETIKLYDSLKKPQKLKAVIGSPRSAQLEEVDKMKRAFTGDSEIIYDKAFDKYHRTGSDAIVEKGANSVMASPTRTKNTENAEAVQETQLVAVDKFKTETLANNVDLEKVREARRVLRRKYANRTNLQKIYAAWDEDNTGNISAENVFSMSKKLGLNLNYDEARVLVASADKSASGCLSIDEFLDLIYNKNDALNVNLESLAHKYGEDYTIRKEELENGRGNVIKKLQEDAKKTSEVRHMNQLKLILKNRVHDLATAMTEIDPDKSGYVNMFKFEQAIQKLRINENVISQKDVKDIFEKHRADRLSLNYKEFLTDLKNFNFQYDQEYQEIVPPKVKKQSSALIAAQLEAELMNQPPKIVDCRTLPYNMIVNFHTRSKKVGRAIQRFFPTKEELHTYLGNKLNIEKEKVPGHYIASKDFHGLVDDLFRQFDISSINRKDMEGFLSSVLYNKHGFTTFKEISHTIYDEDENQFFEKIQKKKKGPVPHGEIASSEFASFEPAATLATEEFEENGNRLEIDLKSPSKPERLGDSLPTIRSNGFLLSRKNNHTSVPPAEKITDPALRHMLQDIDNKIFMENKSALKTFREFDVDGDGFVSHKDLVTKLESDNLLDKNHLGKLLSYIDPNKKGYVDFIEFSQRIRPNMVFDDENGNIKEDKAKTSLYFCKPDFDQLSKSTVSHRKTMQSMKKSLEASNIFADKFQNTRYSAHPGWSNTFLKFQAKSNSSMFICEEERFDRHRLAATKFQTEEKIRQQSLQEGRLEARRENQRVLQEKIEKEIAFLEARDRGKLNTKYQHLVAYEQNARLRNGFA